MITLTKTQFVFAGLLNGLVLIGDVFDTLAAAFDGELSEQVMLTYAQITSSLPEFHSVSMKVGDILHWFTA